jgi:hypothetical protein
MRYLGVLALITGCAQQPTPPPVFQPQKSKSQAYLDCTAMAEKTAKTSDIFDPTYAAVLSGCMYTEGWPSK